MNTTLRLCIVIAGEDEEYPPGWFQVVDLGRERVVAAFEEEWEAQEYKRHQEESQYF